MIQIDGPQRRIYIKLHTIERTQSVLQTTNGQMDFNHETGELSKVQIELAGMGTRGIRIANLPLEIPKRTICDSLSSCGDVKEISEEVWTKAYRYQVLNGIRIAITNPKKHIPSHLIIAGNRVLIPYDGQPPTCYGCNGTEHQYHDCPRRKQANGQQQTHKNTWADIV